MDYSITIVLERTHNLIQLLYKHCDLSSHLSQFSKNDDSCVVPWSLRAMFSDSPERITIISDGSPLLPFKQKVCLEGPSIGDISMFTAKRSDDNFTAKRSDDNLMLSGSLLAGQVTIQATPCINLNEYPNGYLLPAKKMDLVTKNLV